MTARRFRKGAITAQASSRQISIPSPHGVTLSGCLFHCVVCGAVRECPVVLERVSSGVEGTISCCSRDPENVLIRDDAIKDKPLPLRFDLSQVLARHASEIGIRLDTLFPRREHRHGQERLILCRVLRMFGEGRSSRYRPVVADLQSLRWRVARVHDLDFPTEGLANGDARRECNVAEPDVGPLSHFNTSRGYLPLLVRNNRIDKRGCAYDCRERHRNPFGFDLGVGRAAAAWGCFAFCRLLCFLGLASVLDGTVGRLSVRQGLCLLAVALAHEAVNLIYA